MELSSGNSQLIVRCAAIFVVRRGRHFLLGEERSVLLDDNVVTIGQYIARLWWIGAGEVLLLTLGEIDLSAGEIFLLGAGCTGCRQMASPSAGRSRSPCSAASPSGDLYGSFTIRFNLLSFVTTLGTYYNVAMLGLVLIVSNDAEVTMVGSTGRFGQIFGTSNWGELRRSAS